MYNKAMTNQNLPKTEEEWKAKLGEERFRVLREKATEAPFTGKLLANKETGMYTCGACGAALFDSKTKYNSGCGWPSFWDIAKKGAVDLIPDNSLGMQRTEVVCTNCGSHLGHLFNDGPADKTGMRYCINSASLDFEKK